MIRMPLLTFVVLVAFSLMGCGGLEGLGANAARNRPPAAAVPPLPPQYRETSPTTLPSYRTVAGLSGNITSIGDATTTNLAARAIIEFRRIYPAVTHNATAGLSSIGPAALLLGKADIAPMSRALTPAQIGIFEKKYGYAPTEIKVATDALAIYGDKRNPLPSLALA